MYKKIVHGSMFSQFISWKFEFLAHFFYFHSRILKYLSPLIMQNHIFLLILALLSRAQGVDTSTDLQKLERSVLCVRNCEWNLRNPLQTRYVALPTVLAFVDTGLYWQHHVCTMRSCKQMGFFFFFFVFCNLTRSFTPRCFETCNTQYIAEK